MGVIFAVICVLRNRPPQTSRAGPCTPGTEFCLKSGDDFCARRVEKFPRSSKILLQNGAILRNTVRMLNRQIPSASNAVQNTETMCNSLGENYKSVALNHLSYAGVPHTNLTSMQAIQRKKHDSLKDWHYKGGMCAIYARRCCSILLRNNHSRWLFTAEANRCTGGSIARESDLSASTGSEPPQTSLRSRARTFSSGDNYPSNLPKKFCLTTSSKFQLIFRLVGVTHAFALDCIFGSVLRLVAITHRKNRLGSTPRSPFWITPATERADNPKITLGAPALHQRPYRTLSGTWFPCSRSVIGYRGFAL